MAKTKQKIKDEAMQVKVIERTQQIQLQEQEIIRRERELEAQVRKPAEAEKYRLEKLAEANRLVYFVSESLLYMSMKTRLLEVLEKSLKFTQPCLYEPWSTRKLLYGLKKCLFIFLFSG